MQPMNQTASLTAHRRAVWATRSVEETAQSKQLQSVGRLQGALHIGFVHVYHGKEKMPRHTSGSATNKAQSSMPKTEYCSPMQKRFQAHSPAMPHNDWIGRSWCRTRYRLKSA